MSVLIQQSDNLRNQWFICNGKLKSFDFGQGIAYYLSTAELLL